MISTQNIQNSAPCEPSVVICAAILSKEASKVRSLMECVPYKSLFPDSTPPHAFVYQGRSILYFAAGIGDKSIVKYICERHPALLHHPTVYGACPLTWAAYNGQLDSVKVLLEKGCDVNQKGEYEETALIAACCQGHLAVVQCLLAQSNVDICKRDHDGKTALFRAAIGNHSDIVDLLLQAAKKNKKEKELIDDEYTSFWCKSRVANAKIVALIRAAVN